jgi:hypothetical protein
LNRPLPLTDMPAWLLLALVALGVPRTILEDMGVVAPESGLLYFVLALTPFAIWLVVAVVRPSGTPFMDFLVVGILYALSLIAVHMVLWNVGPSLGQHPPEGAVAFAERFSSSWYGLALRGYMAGIALVIGIGSGVVAALAAVAARRWLSGTPRSGGR